MAVTANEISHPIPVHEAISTMLLTLAAPAANTLTLRYAALADRSDFGKKWQCAEMTPASTHGYFQIDLATLGLADGTYEFDLLINGRTPVADPYALELEKFNGYRGILIIRDHRLITEAFDWSDEIPAGLQLPENNKIVLYELPLRWMSSAEGSRQVALGTFEKAIFEHLDDLHVLGVNAIELLPVQDSADTLNWGYGTRFFFAPDWDLGTPVDMKFFIKSCHQLGIRVIMDVVMNHSRECPLETLAEDWFYLPKGSNAEGAERQDWGGRLFRYATPVEGKFHAREFMYDMAVFWIQEYHIDGFRIDEWKGINNWDFLQEFRDRAHAAAHAAFPNRPFLVLGEDSARRPEVTDNRAYNNHPLVDAIWNFDFRDEIRRLLNNTLCTRPGEPGRLDRIRNLISSQRVWDDQARQYRAHGFTDLAKTINYVTSHDVAGYSEQRLMNFFLTEILRYRGLLPTTGNEEQMIRDIVDNIACQSGEIQSSHAEALERIGSAFALMLTSVGTPMFLAGEEFGDVHDLDHSNPSLKQSDPVDFARRNYLGHNNLLDRVSELVRLRTQHSALQRNEVEFFHAHPSIDNDNGIRVFAYSRTGGQPLGSSNQVIVVANAGPQNFYGYNLPWAWTAQIILEHGRPGGATIPQQSGRTFTVSLAPFQVRVFTSEPGPNR